MARMIPGVPPREGQPGWRAEKPLYEALQRDLDSSFTVYHGKLFVNPQKASEGEMDFLICHRELGLLAVECKGSSVVRDERGRWVRRNRYGPDEPMKESPYAQVQRHVRVLVAGLQPRLRAAGYVGRAFPYRFGHAVAFPNSLLDHTALPLEGGAEITLGSKDLRDIDGWVRAVYAHWSRVRSQPPVPSVKKWEHFLRHILHPEIHIVHSLGADLELESQQFHRLTAEQSRAIQGLSANRRLRITGGAGTGKTVVALEMARTLASQGKNVWWLCYNRYLARHLWESIRGWEFDEGRVDARHFHSLCLRAVDALDKTVAFPPKDADAETTTEFWNEQMPMLLLEAQDAGVFDQWDAVVVDEGQDFEADWWPLVEDLLAEKASGTLIVMHDDAQDIFGRGAFVPDFGFVYTLSYNLRNTRCIAEVVQQLGEVTMASHPDVPDGVPPKIREQSKRSKAVKDLDGLIRGLLGEHQISPNQIAILTPHSRANSVLADRETLGDVALTTSPFEDGIFHGSISSYKGLEADVLILADIDPADPRCNRKARYVASSRAKLRLYVFTKGDWLAVE